ncbi:hypothetical protein [Paenibacillus sp. 22594]|uniref:hypothetical protein n=1 Tax=Paenibacillus sp. 22594 TaxID=3453947 RepID=UPI003F84936B
MLSLPELPVLLLDNNCDFGLIAHETPIRSTQDAEQYFDLARAVPTHVVRLNRILAFIV